MEFTLFPSDVDVFTVEAAFIANLAGFLVLMAVLIVETELFRDSSSTWMFWHFGDLGTLSLVPNISCHHLPAQKLT